MASSGRYRRMARKSTAVADTPDTPNTGENQPRRETGGYPGTNLAVIPGMRSKLTHIAIMIALLLGVCGFCSGAHADGGTLAAGESALFELINQARENPYVMAESLGMDLDAIIAEFPDMYDILTNGLPPLTFNEALRAAASVQADSTVLECCYSEESSDGRTLARRIADAGYMAVETGESIGAVAFTNFIEAEEAAKFLVEEMFRGEVDPERTGPRTILNPDLEDVGVALETGTLNLGRLSYNIYVVACDFGTVISGPEGDLLQLINQARENPFETAQSLGIDIDAFLEERPELRAAFEQGLAPLTINASIVSASEAHVRDMQENNYYGKISLDGRTCEDRIEASGYPFETAGESLGITWFTEPIDLSVAVGRVFENMLQDELEPSNGGSLTILDPGMQEAGIAFGEGDLWRGNEERNVYLAICDVALPAPVDAGGQ